MPPADPLARIRERVERVRQGHSPAWPEARKTYEDLLVAVEALDQVVDWPKDVSGVAQRALDRIAAGSEEGL